MENKRDITMLSGQEQVFYQNPVLTGFHADPSICRVGNDFYLAVSSFLYFPGLPIYHSCDLLHWEQIGNAVSWNNPINLHEMQETGGIWAPTLRFHNGLFFLTAAVEGYGNFIIHAENPAGPWSIPVWVKVGGVDPDLFWENDILYYSTNERCGDTQETISTGVVNPFTGNIEEPFRPIWHGSGGPHLEAPHLYHIGDWYYLMAAEGGTASNHMITIARSRTIFGEYEECPYNPILTNRDDAKHEIYGTGHGDLIEDINGNWWIVCLGTRAARRTMSHLGRETFLMPVRWADGWPLCGTKFQNTNIVDVSVHMQECGPIPITDNLKLQYQNKLEDTFDNANWPFFWHFLANPDMQRYQRKNGELVIRPNKSNMLLVTPQPDFECSISATVECYGADCGLILYHTQDFYYRFGLTAGIDSNYKLSVQIHAGELVSTVAEMPWSNNTIRLHIDANKEQYTFGYEDNHDFVSFTTRFLANEVVGRSFTGTMAGVYADSSETEKDVYAIVKMFEVTY